jgi:hypothetical protein
MHDPHSVAPATWQPDKAPTPAQPIQQLPSPTLALAWVLFTAFHAMVLLNGFWSQPWVLGPLVVLYAVLFAIGWQLLGGHVHWWLQSSIQGLPTLLSQPSLRKGQVPIIRLQGFKAAAQHSRLHAVWLHERGTLAQGRGQSLRWHEAWRSESFALHWVPVVHGQPQRDGLQAQVTLPVPPHGAGTRASLMSRWSIIVVPTAAVGTHGVIPRLALLQDGWRFPLDDNASATMGFADPVVLKHLSALESAQAQAQAACMACALRVVRAPWIRHATHWLPACVAAAVAWSVLGDSFLRLWDT